MMAKCFLLLQADGGALKATTHGFIETKFNYQGKLGNVSSSSVQLLNRLSQLRPKTRYALKSVHVADSELQRLLEAARQMRTDLEGWRPKRNKSGDAV